MKNKEYVISPSALSYLCNHCQYLIQNYELYNKSISAGITTTLDGIEKEYFLGDCKKIDKNLPKGEVIIPNPFGFPFLISPANFKSFFLLPTVYHPNFPLIFLRYKTPFSLAERGENKRIKQKILTKLFIFYFKSPNFV